MINDPCNATLVPGIYGSSYGLLARFRNVNMMATPFEGAQYGYVVWFPSYHNNLSSEAAGITNPLNFVYWASDNPAVQPSLVNYGINYNDAVTAHSFADPAFSFVSGDTCQDARTISACMRITYTGNTSDGRGIIAPLKNVPLTAVLNGGSGGNPPSINDLLRYSTAEKRGTETQEVKWRPTPLDARFRDSRSSLIDPTAGSPTSISNQASADPPVGIGFVIYNVLAMSEFSISTYKNIEWRPEPVSGLVSQTPTGVENPTFLSKALTTLDRLAPNWQTSMKDAAISMAQNALTNLVLGGTGNASYLALVD